MKEKHVNIDNSRGTDVTAALQKIEAEKICPFCGKDYLTKEHKKPILEETGHWLATENRWPYKGSRNHLLFIHKKHADHLNQVSASAWNELKDLVDKMVSRFNIPGATLLLRFGDSRHTGGTVTHLHAQLISGDPDKGEPVIARVG